MTGGRVLLVTVNSVYFQLTTFDSCELLFACVVIITFHTFYLCHRWHLAVMESLALALKVVALDFAMRL